MPSGPGVKGRSGSDQKSPSADSFCFPDIRRYLKTVDTFGSTEWRRCGMTIFILLLAASASPLPPTNSLTEYKKCLIGSRQDEAPPGSPVEAMAAAIARCGAKREAAITLLHADAPKDEEARNRAELELIQQEMSLIWTQARQRLPISVHSDRWGSNGPCL